MSPSAYPSVSSSILLQLHEVGMQFVQLRVRHLGGGPAGHLALQRGTDIDKVIEDCLAVITFDNCLQHQRVKQVPMCRRQDRGAVPLFHNDKALFFQEFERLADDGAAHAVVLAQNWFGGQGGAHRERPGYDPVDQGGNHGLAQAGRTSTPRYSGESATGDVISAGTFAWGRLAHLRCGGEPLLISIAVKPT
jgi:hypothetical protein